MMGMPNVLMIGPSPYAMGGMASVEKNMLGAMRRRGEKVVFIPTTAEGGKAKKLAVAMFSYIKYRERLRECNLVHVHMASRGSYRRKKVFIATAFSHNKPVLLHLHGSEFATWYDEECSEEEKLEISRIFNRCAKVVVLSEEWKDFLLTRRICDLERIEILHNAVNIPSKNTTAYDRNTVLFMGRLDERKSPDVLLRSAVQVLALHPDARFIFGGDGNALAYEQLACDLGISNSCSFIGWATSVKKDEAFRSSSIFCLPSKNEGMPMSVLEAMSYGLASVATPVGGIPQVITDGVDGLLFPVDDVDVLTEKLDSLMSDKATKERIGRRGRTRIEEAFSLDAFMDRLGVIYEEICR